MKDQPFLPVEYSIVQATAFCGRNNIPSQSMNLASSVTGWRTAFLIAVGVFLMTRGLTLTAFPIFNDEAIYLQYSQAIHDDWQKNKYISMNGEWTDWKPPLQYWMAAPVIYFGRDPLIAGRAVALFVSLLGLFGFYLFAKEYVGQREAVVTMLLYASCPPVLFQNNQFTAETFLFSTAPFFYWALLKMMQPKHKLPWAVLAALVGTALLLFKQSGLLLLAVAIALPFAQIEKKDRSPSVTDGLDREGRRVGQGSWKEFSVNCCCVATVILFSQLIARLMIPREFDVAKNHFNGRWVMSVRELFQLPLTVWQTNLRVAVEYVGSYYSWAIPLFFCTFTWFAWRRKSAPDLALVFMCLTGGSAVILLLRGFNEYLLNTAIIAVLLPMLAKTGLLVWNMTRIGKTGCVRGGLLVCAAFMAGHWGYQIALLSSSPGRYLERSTHWAVANYLKGWSTGFGVKEIVAMLEKENKPGVLFADTQWGNPRTALEVYAKTRFPKLRIVPVSKEFLDPIETRKLRDAARKMGLIHLVIFSADNSEEREQWVSNVERQMCESRTEIRAYSGQTPIIICSF